MRADLPVALVVSAGREPFLPPFPGLARTRASPGEESSTSDLGMMGFMFTLTSRRKSACPKCMPKMEQPILGTAGLAKTRPVASELPLGFSDSLSAPSTPSA